VAPPTTRVTCNYTFEAAHRLPWHTGRCRDLHGHSYRLEVTVGGALDGNGIIIDFEDLAGVVQRKVLDQFDHRDLNEILENPTAELLAHRMWELLEGSGLPLVALRLWETTDCSVELTAGDGKHP